VFLIAIVSSSSLGDEYIEDDDYLEEDYGLMREARQRGEGPSCTREMCAKALETGKVGKACVKTPFCDRKFLREHKKLKKQQARVDATIEQRCGGGRPNQGEKRKEEAKHREE